MLVIFSGMTGLESGRLVASVLLMDCAVRCGEWCVAEPVAREVEA